MVHMDLAARNALVGENNNVKVLIVAGHHHDFPLGTIRPLTLP